MNQRYLTATNGKITVFRDSSGAYRAAVFASRRLADGRDVVDGRISFSRLDAAVAEGSYPVHEVTRSQYQALYGQAIARLIAIGGPLIVTPNESWFANAAALDSTPRQ